MAAASETRPLDGLVLVVVDDEPDQLEFLATVFEDNGAKVLRASTGDEALAKRFLGMRPARNDSRPASMAFFMAEAIRMGSRAPAIAVFISTPPGARRSNSARSLLRNAGPSAAVESRSTPNRPWNGSSSKLGSPRASSRLGTWARSTAGAARVHQAKPSPCGASLPLRRVGVPIRAGFRPMARVARRRLRR